MIEQTALEAFAEVLRLETEVELRRAMVSAAIQVIHEMGQEIAGLRANQDRLLEEKQELRDEQSRYVRARMA